jgi:tRNA A-37 threonylcarbamoyl transferase component Bud32
MVSLLEQPVVATGADHQVGPYRLNRRIGSGASGYVFEGVHVVLGRRAAVKVLKDGPYADWTDIERFLREACLTSKLSHPNIVTLFEYGGEAGRHFIAMELATGSLADVADKLGRDLTATARLMEKAARAVQHAHEGGIVHRDLKPSNILLTASGEPLIADFGLARRAPSPDDGSVDASWGPVGTPGYMSPEQVSGDRSAVGFRSDIWALGVILFRLIAGRMPFVADDFVGLAMKTVSEQAPLLSSVRPDVPPELEAIARRCLQTRAEQRYPSAGALADDLAAFLDGRSVSAAAVVRRNAPAATASLAGVSMVGFATLLASTAWMLPAHSGEMANPAGAGRQAPASLAALAPTFGSGIDPAKASWLAGEDSAKAGNDHDDRSPVLHSWDVGLVKLLRGGEAADRFIRAVVKSDNRFASRVGLFTAARWVTGADASRCIFLNGSLCHDMAELQVCVLKVAEGQSQFNVVTLGQVRLPEPVRTWRTLTLEQRKGRLLFHVDDALVADVSPDEVMERLRVMPFVDPTFPAVSLEGWTGDAGLSACMGSALVRSIEAEGGWDN